MKKIKIFIGKYIYQVIINLFSSQNFTLHISLILECYDKREIIIPKMCILKVHSN